MIWADRRSTLRLQATVRSGVARNYWWVNQGRTFADERRGGYLWAPKRAPNGQTKNFWSRMTEVEVGDLVFHYSRKHVVALGRADTAAYDALLPREFPSDAWGHDGWRIDVTYGQLADPIALDEIPSLWREGTKEEPFDIRGAVKQGYLYPLSDTFAFEMFDLFGERLPYL